MTPLPDIRSVSRIAARMAFILAAMIAFAQLAHAAGCETQRPGADAKQEIEREAILIRALAQVSENQINEDQAQRKPVEGEEKPFSGFTGPALDRNPSDTSKPCVMPFS